MNPQLVSSALLNNAILSFTVLLTVVCAMILGVWSGYVAIGGILRAMNRRSAEPVAIAVEAPLSAAQ